MGRTARIVRVSGTIAKAIRNMRRMFAIGVAGLGCKWNPSTRALEFLRKEKRFRVGRKVVSPQGFILRLARTATIVTPTTAKTAIVPPRSAEAGRLEEYDVTDEPELDDEEPTVSGTDVECDIEPLDSVIVIV